MRVFASKNSPNAASNALSEDFRHTTKAMHVQPAL